MQAALKLVLEPIFEADFKPASYGFRPKRRAQDAIAEIHQFTSRGYEWVLEGDITACFDEISHVGLQDRLRRRIGDKRVLSLVKAFLKAGILSEDGVSRDTITGTPQGGILSPLLANIALSVLDEHFAEAWESWGNFNARNYRRRKGDAPPIAWCDTPTTLSLWWPAPERTPRRCVTRWRRCFARWACACRRRRRRSSTSTRGSTFLGFRIQRQRRRGSNKRFVYTWPSKKALASVKAKVRTITRGGTNQPLEVVLRRLNPVLRGLGQLLPARRVQSDLRLPERLQLAAGDLLASPQASPGHLEVAAAPLSPGVAANRRHGHPVQPRCRSRSPATAIGARRSRRRGPEWRQPSHSTASRARGEPDAWEHARPVRECGSGKQTVRKDDTAPPARSSLSGQGVAQRSRMGETSSPPRRHRLPGVG